MRMRNFSTHWIFSLQRSGLKFVLLACVISDSLIANRVVTIPFDVVGNPQLQSGQWYGFYCSLMNVGKLDQNFKIDPIKMGSSIIGHPNSTDNSPVEYLTTLTVTALKPLQTYYFKWRVQCPGPGDCTTIGNTLPKAMVITVNENRGALTCQCHAWYASPSQGAIWGPFTIHGGKPF